MVGRLVLSAFVAAHGRSHLAAYRDGNPNNVALDNLQWLACRGASKARERRAKDTVPLGEALRYKLNQNAAWAEACRALKHAKLGPDDRDDVAANMVVAHLSGELALEDFAARAASFAKSHNAMFGRLGLISLDQTVRGTDDLRLGDTFSEEEYRDRWAALGA